MVVPMSCLSCLCNSFLAVVTLFFHMWYASISLSFEKFQQKIQIRILIVTKIVREVGKRCEKYATGGVGIYIYIYVYFIMR